jgi:hypothetical protein
MKMNDMNEVLGMLKQMIELKAQLQEKYDACRKEDDDEDCDECESDEQKVADELQNDYDSFMKWCFGDNFDNLTRNQSIINWTKLHPNLPLPRTLTVNFKTKDIHTMCLMIDAFPMYLEHKKSVK